MSNHTTSYPSLPATSASHCSVTRLIPTTFTKSPACNFVRSLLFSKVALTHYVEMISRPKITCDLNPQSATGKNAFGIASRDDKAVALAKSICKHMSVIRDIPVLTLRNLRSDLQRS